MHECDYPLCSKLYLIRSVPEEAIQYSWLSRHIAVCQQLRIQKMHGPQVCNTGTVKLLNSAFCISKPSQLLSQFQLTYTIHLSNLKEITSAFLEIFVPKTAQFSSHFSSSLHKITSIFKSPFHVLISFKFVIPVMLI